MSKIIDVLSEDAPITGQTYALISIVGPNLKQKCSMYGIKIRGVADSIEKSKIMTKRIMNADNDYDIYTVEVGKFFPLNIDPMDVSDIEYENEQLNSLVKNYLENRHLANDHYHERKNALMKKAIQEGQKEGQAELAKKQEHPISVLQRKQNYEDKLKELKEEVQILEKDLELTSNKYNTYTHEERKLAIETLQNGLIKNESKSAVVNVTEDVTVTQTETKNVTEDVNETETKDVTKDVTETEDVNETETKGVIEDVIEDVTEILSKLKLTETLIDDVQQNLTKVNKEDSPNKFDQLEKEFNRLVLLRGSLKEILNNKSLVNNYINSSYTGVGSSYHSLFN